MTIPTPAYPPPFTITRASHVVWAVKDLGASRAFYVDALGFLVSDETKDALYLRGIEEAAHHGVVLKRTAGAPACERVGLRVYTDDDLDRAKRYFDDAGLPAAWVDVPHQGKTLHVTDVSGALIEFCATMDAMPRNVVQFRNQRAACPQRIDHFQLHVTDVQRQCDFYAALGFRLAEYVAIDGTDDLVFVFMQRKGNPHDIVFAGGPGPRLHHVAFSIPDAHHLIHACDMAGAYGFGENLEFGPGRHGPGHALFVYFRDPDGHRIELFNTHYQTMDSCDAPVRWEASNLRNRPWGLPARRSWHEEASRFAGVEVAPPAKPGNPMTLERYLAGN